MTLEQITSRDGTRVGFWRSGAGHPLLLVHGTTADHSRWSGVSQYFEQHFTVYAMDRRGRGASSDSPAYDLLREAEDVAEVVEAISEQVFVLGHSYGGLCSLEAALLTDKVSRLILYEPPVPNIIPMYPIGVPDRIQNLVDAGELEAALETFFRDIVRMPEQELDAYRKLPVWNIRISLAPTIPRELLIDRIYRFDAKKFSSLQIPTMLLLGGNSPEFFRRAVELVKSALPDSRVVNLPEQQHVAMDTHPELFVKEVLEFLLQ